MNIEMEIRWRMGAEALRAVDPLVFRLLEGIAQGGSLRSAVDAAGVSYRHAWGLLQSWEHELGQALVQLERGRGAALTALGERLVWAERRALARLGPQLETLSAEAEQELSPLVSSAAPIRIIASNDVALGKLRELALAQGSPKLNLQYRGSLDAVRQLAAGHCDIAGFHLSHLPEIVPVENAVYRLLQPDRFGVISFVYREQGLMAAPGNPLGIHTVEDLARPEVTLINRQPGSGTRVLLDALLQQAGISPDRVHGYENEEYTHAAVAAMVASGAASAGFGIHAAAARFGLAFMPLIREQYLLAFSRQSIDSERLQRLVHLMQDGKFRREVDMLPGYAADGIGTDFEFNRSPR